MKRVLKGSGWVLVGLWNLPLVVAGAMAVGYLLLQVPVRLIAVIVGVDTGPFDRLWWP